MEENWRDVVGYEGRYLVSDQGRVRSLSGRVDIMRQILDSDGYLFVTLTSSKSKQWPRRVHYLVLRAFVGARLSGWVTRHLDGVQTNNRLSNLSYGTTRENFEDRKRHGTHPSGEKNGHAKLTAENVAYIRAQPYVRGTYSRLAEKFGVTPTQISYVARNKNWVN